MKTRIWKTIRVTLRCSRTRKEREYFIETKAGWRFAERKARQMAEADGFIKPESRGGEWVNNPWYGAQQ